MEIITTEDVISHIYLNPAHKYDIWIEFINKFHPTVRVVLNEDSDFFTNDDNAVFGFVHSFGLEPKIEENYDTILSYFSLHHPYEEEGIVISIINTDREEAEKLSTRYGIICLPLDSPLSENSLFQEGIEKSVERGEDNSGWDQVLAGNLAYPSNAIIFIDRYMFANDSHQITSQHGVANVFEVLDSVLPKKLDISYHVLLAFDASTLDSDNDFRSMAQKVNKLKRQLNRPYTIEIELVSIDKNYLPNYDETHNRRIISNYFIVRLDRSLKAFDNAKSLYSQTIWLDWLGSKGIIRQKNSDTPYKAQRKYLKELRKAVASLQRVQDQQAILFAQNANLNISIKDIKNRLLK